MAEHIENQGIKKHGGPRPNSGRPKHSRDKLKVTDFFSPQDKEELVAVARSLVFCEKPDRDMVKFLWEQIFGKAKQPLTGSDDPSEALKIILTNYGDHPTA